MKILVLLLLLHCEMIFGGDTSITCEKRAEEHCPEMKPTFESPETEEDFDKLCPKVINRMECLQNYYGTCPEKQDFYNSEQLSTFVSLIREICDKSTLLHRVITENIRCLRQSISAVNETCFPAKVTLLEAYSQRMSEIQLNDEELQEQDHVKMCLHDSHFASCLLDDISQKCGSLAGTAAKDIFRRSISIMANFCSPEFVPQTLEIIKDLEVSSEVKKRLQEFFELK